MIYGHPKDHKHREVVGNPFQKAIFTTVYSFNSIIMMTSLRMNKKKNEQLHHFYSRYYIASGLNVKCMVNQIRSAFAIEHLNI